jgi:protease PrsW
MGTTRAAGAAGDGGNVQTRPAPARSPRFFGAVWAAVLVLAVGLVLYGALREAYTDTRNPNLVPALLFLGAVTAPAAFMTFIYRCGLRFDVSALTLMIVGVTGGAVGIATAGVLERHTLVTLGRLPMTAVAVIEELAKLLAPAAILLVRRYRRPTNGLLLGAASGAGFAVMETLGYSAVALISSHDQVSQADQVLLQRGLFTPATHMAWTGLTAAALWYAAARGWRPRALAVLAGVFAVTVVLHATWNILGSTTADVALSACSLGGLAAAAWWLARGDPGAPAGSDTRRFLTGLFASWQHAPGPGPFAAALAADASFTMTGGPRPAGADHGKAEDAASLVALLTAGAGPRPAPVVRRLLVDGEWAAVQLHERQVGGRGQPEDLDYTWFVQVRDGQIRHITGVYGTARPAGPAPAGSAVSRVAFMRGFAGRLAAAGRRKESRPRDKRHWI